MSELEESIINSLSSLAKRVRTLETRSTGISSETTDSDISLGELTDVSSTVAGASDRDALVFDQGSSEWIPEEIPRSLEELSDVSISSPPSDGNLLEFDSSSGRWIPGDGLSTIGPFAPDPHDLDGDHHTGTISDDQGPQFFLLDGTRTITGNIDLSELSTVDGVDLSEFKSDFDSHNHDLYHLRLGTPDVITAVHSFEPASTSAPFSLGTNAQGQLVAGFQADQLNKSVIAGDGLLTGGLLTADVTLEINEAFEFVWSASHEFQSSINLSDAIPRQSYQFDLGSADKLWGVLHVAELDTFLIKADAISVMGGKQIVAKAEGLLPLDVDAVQTDIDFSGILSVGDFILLKTLLQVEFMQITAFISGTTYTVTRNVDGTGANSWPAGSVWVDLGSFQDGRIELEAVSTPRISIVLQGATFDEVDSEPLRIGDLEGWDDVVGTRYGVGIGDFSGENYFKYDPVEGFSLRSGDGKLQIDPNGFSFLLQPALDSSTAIKWTTSYGTSSLSSLTTYSGTGGFYASEWVLNTPEPSLIRMRSDHDFGSQPSASIQLLAGWDLDGISDLARKSQVILTAQGDTAERSSVGLSADDILITKHEDGANASSPIISIEETSSNPSDPSSTKIKLYSRYGIPTIRRSNGAMHSLIYADKFLEAIPGGTVWAGSSMVAGSFLIADRSGGGNHLTRSGAGVSVAPNAGTVGKTVLPSVSFNGSTYAYRTNANQLQPNNGNYQCLGGWYYLDAVNRYHSLMQFGVATPNISLYINNANGIEFRFWNTIGTFYTHGVGVGVTTGWHFFLAYLYWNSSVSQQMGLMYDGTWWYYTPTSTSTIRAPGGDFRLGHDGSNFLLGKFSVAFTGDYSGCIELGTEYYNMTRNLFK